METMTLSSVLISIFCVVIVTGLIKVVNWVWLRPKKLERLLKQQGFSGTCYKFLIGDLKDFTSMRTQALKTPMNGFSNDYFQRVEPFRHHLASKFGNDFFLWFGPIPMLSISKPELVREAFTKTHDIRKPKVNPVFDKLFPGLVSYEGEKWAQHRKLINPAFHMEKLKLMLPAFCDSCAEIINRWEMVVAKTGSGELDVWPDLTKLTATVISRAAFGSNYEEGQRIFELLKEQTEVTLLMLQSIYFPGRRFIPTKRNRRFKDIEDKIHASLRAIISKRKADIEAGEAVKADLLGILLDSNSKEIQQAGNNKNRPVGMSLEEVIDECKLFYLAGQETTSTLLVWTLILLSKHQDWQARAQEEVLQTFGDNVSDFEGLRQLKTVTMILYEVLRLYPPAMQVTRYVNKDTNLGLIKVVNWVWFRPKKLEKCFRQQGLPGTSYQFLIGDMKDYASMRTRALESPVNGFSNDYVSRVDHLGHQHSTKFGTDYFVWAGPMPMISISKPELIREAFTKMQEFRKAKFNPVFDKLFPGLVSYEGEKWAKHRKIINPAFHMEKLKLMLPAFGDSCLEMINKWEMLVAETGSGELDAWLDLTKLTADVISRAAFGSSYEEGQRIFELLKEQTDLALLMIHSLYIPGYRYIPTPRNRRFKRLEDQIHTSLCAIINKRKEEIEAGEAVKTDLLGILMDSNLKEIQQVDGNNRYQHLGMSITEVVEECKLFYLAGQETTSTLLVWTLILLSKHQNWQARAREEVLQMFGKNVPDFEGLNHLKTVTMILYEVLRLYPPAFQLSRMIYKDTTLGALSIPSGTMITFPIYSVHRNKEVWGDDALEFKPDRFSEGISKAARGNNAFFPFGWGPRICIGERFAMAETKMALSMILQRFSFELSPSYAHAPTSVIFLQPQHGAQIILHRL